MLHKLAQRARPQTKPAAADPGADRGRPADPLAARARLHAWPALTGLVLGLLALGPALGSGFVLSYDMVFVPAPPVGYADLGLGGGPPRAVPSDLVVALAAKIIPAEFVQKLILIAIFVLACSGAAALLADRWPERVAGRRLPLLAQLVAGVCYAWNPFVAERLIMGQWAMLLGYAGLPWVVREVVRPGGPDPDLGAGRRDGAGRDRRFRGDVDHPSRGRARCALRRPSLAGAGPQAPAHGRRHRGSQPALADPLARQPGARRSERRGGVRCPRRHSVRGASAAC